MMFFTYMLIPLSVGMFPHLFQHWLTAKSAESFKIPVVLHPLFIMIVWVPCVLIGIVGHHRSGGVGSANLPANRVLATLVRMQCWPDPGRVSDGGHPGRDHVVA